MNFPLFITKRLAVSAKQSFSRFIIRIAVAAVTLSVAVMIVAFAMVNGFEHEITGKVFGYWGNIHVTKYGFANSFEDNPLHSTDFDLEGIRQLDNVRHVQGFVQKTAILKANDQIEGVILKGFGKDFDPAFFTEYLVEGKVPNFEGQEPTRDILISKTIAENLGLQLGDRVIASFLKERLERKLTVSGIYNTSLDEFDKLYVMVDIRLLQELNKWGDSVSGYEVFLNQVRHEGLWNNLKVAVGRMFQNPVDYPPHLVDPIDVTANEINYKLMGISTVAESIRQLKPNIFDWLNLQSMNKWFILAIMLVVAIINMITCLLILILERTNMIGILKALGSTNRTIRRIFVYHGIYIAGLGLLFGNILGIGICFLQKYFHIIQLPEASYYVKVAPVDLDVAIIVALNIGTIIITGLVLFLPSILVTRISPIKAVRFN